MKADLRLYRYSLPLVQPMTLQGKTYRSRSGILLHSQGQWGDAAPLPGFSHESLEEVIQEARRGPPYSYPSLRFAWSTLQSFAYNAELANQPVSSVWVPINALVIGDRAEVTSRIRSLTTSNCHCIKLKVGGTESSAIETVAELVDSVRSMLHPHQRLRLDANRCWNWEQALSFARFVGPAQIEYIEEPLADISQLERWLDLTAMPYALDETLCDQVADSSEIRDQQRVTARIDAILTKFPRVAALICKPTRLGSVDVIEQLAQTGIPLIISSCFESGVGVAHLARLAARWTPGVAAGLDTYRWLADDVLVSPLMMSEAGLTYPTSFDVNRAKVTEVT